MTGPGQASRAWVICSRDGLPRRRRASLQRRIVAAPIVETEAGPLGGDVVESPGEPFSEQRKVEVPDALCAADHPASGASRFCLWEGLWERLPAAIEVRGAGGVYSAKAHSRGIDSIE